MYRAGFYSVVIEMVKGDTVLVVSANNVLAIGPIRREERAREVPWD